MKVSHYVLPRILPSFYWIDLFVLYKRDTTHCFDVILFYFYLNIKLLPIQYFFIRRISKNTPSAAISPTPKKISTLPLQNTLNNIILLSSYFYKESLSTSPVYLNLHWKNRAKVLEFHWTLIIIVWISCYLLPPFLIIVDILIKIFELEQLISRILYHLRNCAKCHWKSLHTIQIWYLIQFNIIYKTSITT